ncbi:MAG: hypothetical protein U5K81_11820 [Trueperaceae bacterium]|nr:hypothetical protein [Trueperaceae bacterium]
MPEDEPSLAEVLESAARLQQVVPDAVLVGGTAAAVHAGHRDSFDHDHVLADLKERFDMVLEAIEHTEGWVTNRVVPSKIILGRLGDIEAGVRQMRRRRPLETVELALPSGNTVRVPTLAETLRVKAYLLVRRNQTRDFIDVAALSDRMGTLEAARALIRLDAYYTDQHEDGDGVSSQVTRQLADPRPADSRTPMELERYKHLVPRWQTWSNVVAQCQQLAQTMLLAEDDTL